MPAMGNDKERNEWISIPQFGGWEHKAEGVPTDYSMVFSRACANKKQNKNGINRSTLRNEQDFVKQQRPMPPPTPQPEEESVMRRRKMLNYFSCCIKL